MSERQVGIALEREDAAGPGDLLAQRLCGDRHQPARRSVGGYAGDGNPNTITTSCSPVFATACQTPAGMSTTIPAVGMSGEKS